MTSTSANTGAFIRLTHVGSGRDGDGSHPVQPQPQAAGGQDRNVSLMATSARTSLRGLFQKHTLEDTPPHTHTLMIGFITCFLLSPAAQLHFHRAMNPASCDKRNVTNARGGRREHNDSVTMKLIYSVALIKTNAATASHKTEIKPKLLE